MLIAISHRSPFQTNFRLNNKGNEIIHNATAVYCRNTNVLCIKLIRYKANENQTIGEYFFIKNMYGKEMTQPVTNVK